MTSLPHQLPELVLHDGARLFVASHSLQDRRMQSMYRYAFYALAWVKGGQATFVCDGESFQVQSQTLICMSPGQVCWWEHPDQEAHITVLGFVPQVFTAGALDVRLISDLPFFRFDGTTLLSAAGEPGKALGTLFAQAARRYFDSVPHDPERSWQVLPRERENLLLAYLHAILAEAATLGEDPQNTPSLPAQNADQRLVRMFRMHAAESALQRLPVQHYAELLHVTPDHLARAVRRVTGKTPSHWLQQALLVEATRLLTLTCRPIERIAEDLNFPSATQFSQWVRSHTRQTPTQLRHPQQKNGSSDFQQL